MSNYIPPLRWGRELCDMTPAEANEINRRLDAYPDLLAACQALANWRGMFDENTIETWERIAEQFRQETGYLRPGKDSRLPDKEQRSKAWDDWCERKNAELDQQLRAAIEKATPAAHSPPGERETP